MAQKSISLDPLLPRFIPENLSLWGVTPLDREAPKRRGSLLLDMPIELLIMIYKYLLDICDDGNGIGLIHPRDFYSAISILSTCRRLKDELLQTFHTYPSFCITILPVATDSESGYWDSPERRSFTFVYNGYQTWPVLNPGIYRQKGIENFLVYHITSIKKLCVQIDYNYESVAREIADLELLAPGHDVWWYQSSRRIRPRFDLVIQALKKRECDLIFLDITIHTLYNSGGPVPNQRFHDMNLMRSEWKEWGWLSKKFNDLMETHSKASIRSSYTGCFDLKVLDQMIHSGKYSFIATFGVVPPSSNGRLHTGLSVALDRDWIRLYDDYHACMRFDHSAWSRIWQKPQIYTFVPVDPNGPPQPGAQVWSFIPIPDSVPMI